MALENREVENKEACVSRKLQDQQDLKHKVIFPFPNLNVFI